ncbi:MAG: tRNA (N(6)-L-threonylcarbamoyladenosine(37)-C(2))-methylthiotransferase MtaB [Acidobacteriaceae bacterium]
MKPPSGNVAEYHVENFGCRASRSDGESIAATLRQRGMEPAADPSAARVVVVNTCSVTAEADRQARAYMRRVRRQNPAARILVTGCYAQRAPQELAALREVDAVVGNSHKGLVADVALRLAAAPPKPTRTAAQSLSPLDAQSPYAQSLSPLDAQSSFVPLATILRDDRFAHSELATLPFAADSRQTRPNLKVQDGCGNRCSFCIIPTTRGHSRSIPLATCLDDVRRFVDRGGIELVLSGVNLGRWGRDLQTPRRFEDLVAAILTETALPRLRLSSIEPMDWSPDLLALYREFATGPHLRLARHTHLPLQSGSDAILRRMHRRYRPWHYAERLAKIRDLLPAAAIGADVMIGFPGETDSLFAESYRFIAAQPFTYLHLFPFSARPATPAWELHRQNPVPARAVQERMAALRSLIADQSRSFREQFVGLSLSAVTVEPGAQPSTTEAVTDNFVKLTLDTAIPANRLIEARVTGLTQEGLRGTHGVNKSRSTRTASGPGLPASKFDER